MAILTAGRLAEGPAVPESVLAGLREVHPKADCLWAPGSADRTPRYWVGVWEPVDRYRRRMAELILEREAAKPDEKKHLGVLWWARYARMGFRPAFVWEGVPDGRTVEEFRRRDALYRKRGLDRLLEEKYQAEVDREEKPDESFRDHVAQFATEEYPYICRARSHVPFDGWADRFEGSGKGPEENVAPEPAETH